MTVKKSTSALFCAVAAMALTSCGTSGFNLGFGSSSSAATPPAYTGGGQEFDPYSNTWRPARPVAAPTSQPNAYLAEKAEKEKQENTILKKTTRAMNNTASATAEAVKKPLKWVPFVGGKEKSQDEIDPNYYPAPAPGQ
ncbi:hypothetical protein DES53_10932 [Roseimicrobium gellanilyticum]|uniref:Lipoprotein n=1 Tax=Roseimicrobium gellanilyticum TaxID=748857 RepID=A0A366HD19_9BACT|nr:hypothetical protein [Roseimicrobium gellanilyticum]RBP39605.1 hypothetical protein DES53_10932 [Roseimicrobium gellanilyticum]